MSDRYGIDEREEDVRAEELREEPLPRLRTAEPEGAPEAPELAAEVAPAFEPEPEPDEPDAALEAEPEPEPEVEPEPEAEHAPGRFEVPAGYQVLTGSPTGSRRSVALVVSKFNGEITSRMLERALTELEETGVAREAVTIVPVPGAFELPLAAIALAKTRRYACVVALGCVIRGDTPHFEFVAAEAASGLQLAAIETGVPVAFGVLTTDTTEQAEARIDRAGDAVRGALEMADVFQQLRAAAR